MACAQQFDVDQLNASREIGVDKTAHGLSGRHMYLDLALCQVSLNLRSSSAAGAGMKEIGCFAR
ncbi:hypothetical protein D3C71_2232900 [compost metagenome]